MPVTLERTTQEDGCSVFEYAGPMGQEIVEHVRVSLWFGVEPTG